MRLLIVCVALLYCVGSAVTKCEAAEGIKKSEKVKLRIVGTAAQQVADRIGFDGKQSADVSSMALSINAVVESINENGSVTLVATAPIPFKTENKSEQTLLLRTTIDPSRIEARFRPQDVSRKISAERWKQVSLTDDDLKHAEVRVESKVPESLK